MINNIYYQDLGLVNTGDMFRQAMDEGFAVPAHNFNNMEQLQAIVMGCAKSDSPFILQVSAGARKYANQTMLRYMAQGAVEIHAAVRSPVPPLERSAAAVAIVTDRQPPFQRPGLDVLQKRRALQVQRLPLRLLLALRRQ